MNVEIKGIEIYYPENVVSNHYYIEHFDKLGRDEREFYDMIGQKERKIIKNEEDTTISLGVKAAKKLLKSQKLSGEEIDLVIFTSQFPETFVPTQAMAIHHELNMKETSMVFDLNANCVGMVIALKMAYNQMKLSGMKRAIIIGADYASKHARDDSTVYSYLGDLGCAMLLELDETANDGFITDSYLCNSIDYDMAFYPGCGMSKIYRNEIHKNDKKLTVHHSETIDRASMGFRNIHDILDKSGYHAEDIKLYCVSQATKKNVEDLRKEFGVQDEIRMPYVGDVYGYTGTSSPFLVLHESIKNGTLQRGDLVILWSIGMSYQSYGVLLKF